MHVQVTVDEEGALRNGRFAFSNRFTLVTELLQNARRAGATSVEIEYDVETQILRIKDDGVGIEDFQSLLTINKSGWSEETKSQELPFGVGFSNCLYSATRVIVSSRGKQVDFESCAALAKSLIEVVEVDLTVGTTVELHGVELPKYGDSIRRLVRGFSLPVKLNGVELERRHAIDVLSHTEDDIGYIHLAGLEDGEYSRYLDVYLQGFCVFNEWPYNSSADVNVVHLDSSKFIARLPDRDKLIDEEEQMLRIQHAVSDLWRTNLLEKKLSISNEEFCSNFFDAAKRWNLQDVFDDVPLLPKHVCRAIGDYPDQGESSSDYLLELDAHVTRADVESGRVRLCSLLYPDDENMLFWMFARAKEYINVRSSSLSPGHWAHSYIRSFDQSQVKVEPKDISCTAYFEGEWVSAEIVLCDMYTITVDGEAVDFLHDATVYQERILVPVREESGKVCLQITDYVNDGHWEENIQEQDISDLGDFIRRLRAVDPQKTIHGLLRDLNLEKYPVLQGKTFQFTVGSGRDGLVLELVA